MYLIDTDFEKIKPSIINVYTKIFGEEYSDLIKQRANNSKIIYYEDIMYILNYVNYLKQCKKRQMEIEFLNQSELSNIKIDNIDYTKKLSKELKNEITKFIPNLFNIDNLESIDNIDLVKNYLDYNTKNSTLIDEQVLNNLKDNENKYNDLCKKILLKEKKFYDELNEVTDRMYNKLFKKNKFLINNAQKATKEIVEILPFECSDIVINNIKKVLETKFVENNNSKYDWFKYVNKKNIKNLKSTDQISCTKNMIYSNIFEYFVIVDYIDIDFKNTSKYHLNKNELNIFKKFLNSKEAKKYILSNKNIKDIMNIQTKYYNKTQEDFLNNDYDILKNKENFALTEKEFKNLIISIQNKFVCLSFLNNKPTILFAIRLDTGQLSYTFLHEMMHSITANNNNVGLETTLNSSYMINNRKYEKINEVITDIITLEAVEILEKENTYLLEKKEFTMKKKECDNTSNLTRELLLPFFNDYREAFLKSIILSDHKYIKNEIGKNNFEKLTKSIHEIEIEHYNNFFNMNIDSDVYIKNKHKIENIYIASKLYNKKRKIKENFKKNLEDKNKKFIVKIRKKVFLNRKSGVV